MQGKGKEREKIVRQESRKQLEGEEGERVRGGKGRRRRVKGWKKRE